jgi:hypothetical protein
MAQASASTANKITATDERPTLELLLSRPVFYFDLVPMLAHAGPTMLRNPRRLEILCDQCVSAATGSDQSIFQESGFYLIVTSCNEPHASQLVSRISVALLKYFFGSAHPPQEVLSALIRRATREELVRLAGDEAATAPDADDAASDDVEEIDQSEPRHISDPLADLAAHGFHRAEGFRFGFSPVHDLRRGTIPTFFCNTMRTADEQVIYRRDIFSSIGSRELPRLDQAMLLHALSFSRRIAQAGVIVAVGTSVSFETLAWSKGRQFYQNALNAADGINNAFLIVKLDLVPQGTPPARLAELVASLRPYARRIFVQLPDTDFSAIHTEHLTATGFIVPWQPSMTPAGMSTFAARFTRLCHQQGALSCIDQIPDDAATDVVRAAGVRFAEGNIFRSRILYGDTPVDAIKSYHDDHKSPRDATLPGES